MKRYAVECYQILIDCFELTKMSTFDFVMALTINRSSFWNIGMILVSELWVSDKYND